ncbi:nucleoside triphosphate pyrophosphohydrolase family protein [Actinomadura harenae]|uniref:NTP pyrophosphohydrolase MazG putative catalytic core domain-containing protein n=1 Tax=Actinomadura harenae TaxID=2483351 RepID=A0A3M2LNM5_9ACTN|nr:hypothetical protein [Actinomadura harenae]RMI39017.1 hypothetical protein EBO15_31145 [Actinomadura harenae]
MEPLPQHATLDDLQEYITKMVAERGLAGPGVDSQCLKLGEELGELYEAAAATGGHDIAALGSELADCLILTLSIANRLGINLHKDIRPRIETGRPAPTLADVRTIAARTSGSDADLTTLCLRAGTHAGDLFRAIRKLHGDPADPCGRQVTAGDKLIELIISFSAISHLLDLDLEDAFRAKEAINSTRTWS